MIRKIARKIRALKLYGIVSQLSSFLEGSEFDGEKQNKRQNATLVLVSGAFFLLPEFDL